MRRGAWLFVALLAACDGGDGGAGGGGGGGTGGAAGGGGTFERACLDPGSCDPHADCRRQHSADVCTCRAGWEGDGLACSDVDECAADPARCGPGGSCRNTEGGYACDCPAGYEDAGGACADADECRAGTHDCVAPAVCVDDEGTFHCACPEGYAGASCEGCERGWYWVGDLCVQGTIDCVLNPSICAPGGTCVNVTAVDFCECNPGHEGVACARCAEGFQDADGDGRCHEGCALAALACRTNEECADASGRPTCVCRRGYTGDVCDVCDAGFADRSGDGSCVALSCAAAQLVCPPHAACYDAPFPPACRCDIGRDGGGCDACSPVHEPDGAGNCVPGLVLDPARFLLAAGTDDLGRPVLGAVDTAGWTFVPLVQLPEPVSDLATDPMGAVYAITDVYPYPILRLDPRTGAAETLAENTGRHGVNGAAFDSTRRLLYVGANTGASEYLLTYDPRGGDVDAGGTSINTLGDLGFTYHAPSDTLRGILAYGRSMYGPASFEVAAAGGGYTEGAPVDIAPGLAAPGLAYVGDTLFVAGRRVATEDEWLHAFCRDAAGAMGVDAAGLPARGTYVSEGLLGPITLASDAGGASLHAHGSYGDRSSERVALRIETSDPGDVICVATYEEPLDVVIAAGARFRLLVVASYTPSPRLVVEPGFQPAPGSAEPPVRVFASGTPDGSFTGPLVRSYDSSGWYDLGLGGPSYDPLLATTSVAGTLDWASGAANVRPIAGIDLSGGLAGVPCCADLAAPAFCDASGRVAQVTGVCTPACQSSTVVLDDCADRALHPIQWLCDERGAVERTPSCVADAAGATCAFEERVAEVCETPGSCSTGGGGVLVHTSAETCVRDGTATCQTTTTTCTDRGPECAGGTRTTFVTSCEPSGCLTTPTSTGCDDPPSFCEAGPPLEHVSHEPTCADAATCGPAAQTRTPCESRMCAGGDWVTYGTPACDPLTGCGGDELARERCSAGESHRCAGYDEMEWTRCTCVPGAGCACTTTIEPCPDRDAECVGSGNTILRHYDPYCDDSTDTCSWYSPDEPCRSSCREQAGPDVCT